MKINQLLGIILLCFSAVRLLQPFGGVGAYFASLFGFWAEYALIGLITLSGVYLTRRPRTWTETAFACLPFAAYWIFAVIYTVQGLGNVGISAMYGALILLPVAYLHRGKIAPRMIRGKVLHLASPARVTGFVNLITGLDVLIRGQVGAFPYIETLVGVSPQFYGAVLAFAGVYLITFDAHESGLFVINLPMVIYALFYATFLGVLGNTYSPIPLWLGYVALITFCASQIREGVYVHLDETLEPDISPNTDTE